MNKLTKVGLSALCGSLATVASANAGEIAVSGGATATWTSISNTSTGNGVGLNSGLTFTGSGELDGGQTFALTITQADKTAHSAASLVLTTNALGSFTVSSANGGTGIGGHDDVMPTAWEETWGTGIGTGVDLAKGVSSSMNVGWKSPTWGASYIKAAYSPQNDGVQNADKGVSGANATNLHTGYDLLINLGTGGDGVAGGLEIFAGGSQSENDENVLSLAASDKKEAVVGIKYAYGPLSLGVQKTGEFTGTQIGRVTEHYVNTAYGVALNVSDNLSISYGNMNSKRKLTSQDDGDAPGYKLDMESWQLAYTMGGASIKIAETEADNTNYSSAAANDVEATTVALSFAF